METHPGKGVFKEEKFPNTRKPSHQWVCGEFWNLRGQHNQEGEKKKTLTEYAPPQLPVEKVAQTLAGARQGGAGCMLRVRTGPECPEDNLRELT